MKREHIFLIFILFLTFLSIYLLYEILSPFLSSIVWAILLAMVFYPLFKKLQRLLKKKTDPLRPHHDPIGARGHRIAFHSSHGLSGR